MTKENQKYDLSEIRDQKENKEKYLEGRINSLLDDLIFISNELRIAIEEQKGLLKND